MAEAEPLDAQDFAARFGRVVHPGASGIVLAISGGPDSMALMHLVAELRRHTTLPPIVVGTVDHALRAGSADDANSVEEAARAQGLDCRRLLWSGPKPTRAVQEKAREARYWLLAELCAAVGADHLVTAHTRDDQAETVLFRLVRGSGWAGLAGMAATRELSGITLARPLLGVAKARLIATCRAAGVAFCDDPANTDPRFARARMRRIMPLLAAEGLDAAALARLAGRIARAEDALQQTADAASQACRCAPDDAGAVRLDAARLLALPREIAIRVLGRAVLDADGAPRRLDRLERLAERIADAAAARAGLCATLGGVLMTLTPDRLLDVRREGPRRRGTGQQAATARNGPPSTEAERFPWQV